MRSFWLVIAIACWAAPAHALKLRSWWDEPCHCSREHVRPRFGESGVPTNARLWRLPALDSPDERLRLEPNTSYTFSGTSFLTDAVPDYKPPDAPRNSRVWIDLFSGDDRTRGPISSIGILTTLDRDARIVRLTITDAFGSVTYYMAADDLRACSPGLSILAARVRVSLTAIDLAGNESAPEILDVQPRVYTAVDQPTCAAPPTPHSPLGIALFGMFVMLGSVGTFAAVSAKKRAGARVNAAVQPLPLPSVELIARMQRFRAAVAIAALVALASITTTSYGLFTVIVVGAPVLAWAAIVALIVLWRTGRALALVAHDDAVAEVRYDHVDIFARGQHAVLRASPSLVLRARAHGVPQARI
jgi:hypothetical protein